MENQPPNFIRVDPDQRAMQTLIKVTTAGFRAAATVFTVPIVSPPRANQRFSQFFFPKKPIHYLSAHGCHLLVTMVIAACAKPELCQKGNRSRMTYM